VLHLRSATGLYGAEQVVLGLAREQLRRGDGVRIAAFDHASSGRPALLAAAADQGIPATPLRCRGIADWRCVEALRGLLLASGADVLHCHDYKSIVYGRLAAEGMGIVRVATLHGWLQGGVRLGLYRWLELRALKRFERVCAVSPAIRQTLLEAGLDERRVRRVDNGIDTGRFRPPPVPLAPRGPGILLGTAARLSPEKNLAMLVDAVAECRRRGQPLSLEIIGDGPLRTQLEAQVAALGLGEAVRLRGELATPEHWYPTLDAFVLPSLTEGMPMTVLEALSCGVPVLASAVGAVPDLLQDLPPSRTLPPGDREALVEALLRLRPLQAPRLDARTRVQVRWSLPAMAERYAVLYADAMAGQFGGVLAHDAGYGSATLPTSPRCARGGARAARTPSPACGEGLGSGR
jgi:glycosyltransferase involved in cell wall biosynthesis